MKVKKEFSRFAATYNEHNIIQGKVADRVLSMITGEPKRIIDLGCGTGALFKRITWKIEQFYAVDFAATMLELHPKTAHVETIESDFNDASTFETLKQRDADLLLSASALQWSSDLEKVFDAIEKLKIPYVLALFTSATFQTLHTEAGITSPICNKETIERAVECSLKDVEIEVVNYQLQFSQRREMFRYIKRSGVSGGNRLLSYGAMRRLMREYPLDYLEFEVLFVKKVL